MGSSNTWLTGKSEALVVRHRYDNPVGILIYYISFISFSQIARDFNISDTTIGRINSGKYHFDENKNYPLRKKIN